MDFFLCQLCQPFLIILLPLVALLSSCGMGSRNLVPSPSPLERGQDWWSFLSVWPKCQSTQMITWRYKEQNPEDDHRCDPPLTARYSRDTSLPFPAPGSAWCIHIRGRSETEWTVPLCTRCQGPSEHKNEPDSLLWGMHLSPHTSWDSGRKETPFIALGTLTSLSFNPHSNPVKEILSSLPLKSEHFMN